MITKTAVLRRNLLLSVAAAFAAFAVAASAADAPPVEAVRVADALYTFTNTSCNSVALLGADGVLVVDGGVSPAEGASRLAALRAVSDKPVRLLVNTHWHFDHVNGNEPFGAQGATIVGHAAMRQRMAAGKSDPLPGFPTITFDHEDLAVPTVTFDRELTINFGGEVVELVHPTVGSAHTDGDVVLYFRKANAVHLGDLYFNGLYPFIDVDAGGWVGGMAEACREVLARIDDRTVVIPGHGAVSNKAELETYVAMLEDLQTRVAALVDAGKTLEEVQAAKPTAAYDEVWGRNFLSPEAFTALVYRGIVAHGRN